MQLFVLAASIVAAVSGAVAAPAPAPAPAPGPAPVIPSNGTVVKREWCWDDGFNKGWSARWQVCADGHPEVVSYPHGQTDGCAWNGQPVQAFADGYNYAVWLKGDCKF